MITVVCPNGHANDFDQPWPYHAGFSDVCFLYNDDGDLTLWWDMYDETFSDYLGRLPESERNLALPKARAHIEAGLGPAPHGGKWRFSNPPRCLTCHAPIEPVPGSPIYFVVYPGSINLSAIDRKGCFADALAEEKRAT